MRRVIISLGPVLLVTMPAVAQTTRDIRSTREAYGTRLAPIDPNADLNTARMNRRIDTRINSRLSTRIERYKVGNAADPTTAVAAAQAELSKQIITNPPAPGEE